MKWQFFVLQDGLVGVREIVIKKPMSAKSFNNGYLSKSYWADTHLSSLPSASESGRILVGNKRSFKGERRRLAEQKYWQLQLLRMSTSPG